MAITKEKLTEIGVTEISVPKFKAPDGAVFENPDAAFNYAVGVKSTENMDDFMKSLKETNAGRTIRKALKDEEDLDMPIKELLKSFLLEWEIYKAANSNGA